MILVRTSRGGVSVSGQGVGDCIFEAMVGFWLGFLRLVGIFGKGYGTIITCCRSIFSCDFAHKAHNIILDMFCASARLETRENWREGRTKRFSCRSNAMTTQNSGLPPLSSWTAKTSNSLQLPICQNSNIFDTQNRCKEARSFCF